MSHSRALMIFRQDLRIHDNTALIKAQQNAAHILPIFIFDTTILAQFPPQDARLSFILDALQNLKTQLKKQHLTLQIYHGNAKNIIPHLVTENTIDAIYRNESYGHGAINRDAWIQDRCRTHAIACDASHDYLLVPIEKTPVRKVFTPFFKLRTKYIADNQACVTPHNVDTHHTYKNITPKTEGLSRAALENTLGVSTHHTWPTHMGADRLASFSFQDYDATRNFPAIDGSSMISPYIRFGIISIRELYQKAHAQHADTYISELAWREFWQHIYYHFPYTRTQEFQTKRQHIKRNNDPLHFEAWKNGMTGYPLVDAGMRQLKAQGRMHNRVRMVVASFLTKDLLIDRRWGEKHFANYLLDYDTNVNIGNRQRAASVGADPKPLRIFSPMLQSERFDADCLYIKKRIPELQSYTPKQIHAPLAHNLAYATPIIDHYERSKKAKEAYMDSKNQEDQNV